MSSELIIIGGGKSTLSRNTFFPTSNTREGPNKRGGWADVFSYHMKKVGRVKI